LTDIGEADVVKKNRSVQTQGKEPGATSRRDRRRNMTTTTTGPNGFPVRYLAMAVVAAALAAVIIAISQQAGTDIVQTVFVPKQATSEAVAPSASASGLNDALANGKLDSGFGQTEASTAAAGTPAPTTVEISGQGGLYDALIGGKLTMDSNVEYVGTTETTPSGLFQAWADGKFDESATDAQPSPASTHSPAISGGYQE
jgi:hypothetical protein